MLLISTAQKKLISLYFHLVLMNITIQSNTIIQLSQNKIMTNKQKQTKQEQENALLSLALIILLLLACLADNL
jgi:predicted transposase YdaD